MSQFYFLDSDFDSAKNSLLASAANTVNRTTTTPLRTSRSQSEVQRQLTNYNFSDILQGAALYRPTSFGYDTLDKTLTDSFGIFATNYGEGDASSVVNPGREPIVPGGIMESYNSRNGFGDMQGDLDRSVNMAFNSIHPTEVDAVAGLSGVDFAPPEFIAYGNGHIPASALVQVEGHGANFKLWAPAAIGYNLLRQAAMETGFIDPFLISAYRDFDTQVRLKAEKGKQAATPGKSKHGWGIAVDWNRGFRHRKNDAGETGLEWLAQHAFKFGYVHPIWARPGGSNPEEWHWEYRGHLVERRS